MQVFKCKMCGGTLNVESGTTVAECEFCGSKQTLPRLDDEKRANLYDRANHFRRNNDYDKAMGIYEMILNEDKTDAEAYWSILLCKYGIEYVEDPTTHKRVPTVNRTQYTSILNDEDYISAKNYADEYQKTIYESEARTINEIQKGILEISQKEEPFDVFICYKETDSNGRRTMDSVLAQELYFGLKNEGFKVFFSRITLEDKLGIAYEPYIFAALNSAKVMIVIGTKPEYFNAVWVKNEWSRYLSLIKNGQKKVLIPAYRDMDPYSLPDEFSHLQSQDMTKLGFMQDVIRGIKKIITKPQGKTVAKESTQGSLLQTDLSPLLRRAEMFLEENEFDLAEEYAEKILDINPEYSKAYIVKFLCDMKCVSIENFFATSILDDFEKNMNYVRAMRFSDQEYREYLTNLSNESKYTLAKDACLDLTTNYNYNKAYKLFNEISGYKDSADLLANLSQARDDQYIKLIEEELLVNGFSIAKQYLTQIISQEKFNLAYAKYEDAVCSFAKGLLDKQNCAQAKEILIGLKQSEAVKELIKQCDDTIVLMKKEKEYQRAKEYYHKHKNYSYSKKQFVHLMGYKDSTEYVALCDKAIKRGKRIRLIAILSICLATIITLCSIFISKAVDKKNSAGLELKDNGDYYSVVALINSNADTVSVPETYKGKEIREISSYAFYDCINLTEIILPSTINAIGEYAFAGCENLASITIPESVKSIGDSAFLDCSSLTEITIPNGVDAINYSTFKGCTSLTSITIPESVKSIGDSAFSNCSSLTEITIPNGVEVIKSNTFNYCASLVSISIPKSVKVIHDCAFLNCVSLETITIPDGVDNISSRTFEGCASLTSITLPTSMSNIGAKAFYGCENLKEITIPKGIRSISSNVFYNCSALTKVYLPHSINNIDTNAFKGCNSLTDFYYDGTVASFYSITYVKGNNNPSNRVLVHCSDNSVWIN